MELVFVLQTVKSRPKPVPEKSPLKTENSSDSDPAENLLAEEEVDDLADEKEAKPPKSKKVVPKVCKECGKSYKTNYKLAEHMRKHTGEKPFKCKNCEKAFRSKIGLAQHEAKHTGM